MNYRSIIEAVCSEFKLDATYAGQTVGPSVTRYEFTLGPGVKLAKFAELRNEFAYALASESVRVLAPIPGKSAVGIELPNDQRETVRLDDIPVSHDHPLEVVLGKTVDGDMLTMNLQAMPHLLVAGTTGSGKSSFINTMLVSLLRRADPERVKLVLIDPKMVELTPYEGVPHLMFPVVTEVDQAITTLKWVEDEMDQRYEMMRDAGVRHVDGIGLPYIVVVVDELADLMMSSKQQVESSVVRIAQKARAAGIHLVLATQRPSVDVVTGLIKSNVPSRLAFAAASAIDSRIILDEGGAEELLGHGDGLYLPQTARKAVRVQGAYVSDEEIAEAVEKVKIVHRVEQMVDDLNPEPQGGTGVLDFINHMIQTAEVAGLRGAAFMDQFDTPSKGFRKNKRNMELFCQAPEELGITVDALIKLTGMIKMLKDQALERG